jgi:hypothetical protein
MQARREQRQLLAVFGILLLMATCLMAFTVAVMQAGR